MYRRIAMLAACVIVAATTAFAQFKDNGGKAGSADTSAFGQVTEFTNLSTIFDGVEFRLERLIRDPKDQMKLRLIGKLVNTSESYRDLYLFYPQPRLTDELGNVYFIEAWSGVDACRDGRREDFKWYPRMGYCGFSDGAVTRLFPNVPVTVMFSFVGDEKEGFSADLAKSATYVDASIAFAVTDQSFKTITNDSDDAEIESHTHKVTVPQIPIPAQP